MQEDICGCRPLEYAMHLGMCGIAKEIIFCKGVYLTNIQYDGLSETHWFDITDYEESRCRLSRSPIVFLTLMDRSRLNNLHFNQLFFSPAVQQWFQAKYKALRPLTTLWFILRISIIVLYHQADSALLFSEENYLSGPVEKNGSRCLQLWNKKSTDAWDFALIIICIVYSLVLIVFGILEFYILIFKKSQRWMFSNAKGSKANYRPSYISHCVTADWKPLNSHQSHREDCTTKHGVPTQFHFRPCVLHGYKLLSVMVYSTVFPNFTSSWPLYRIDAKNVVHSLGIYVLFDDLCVYFCRDFLQSHQPEQRYMCFWFFLRS